MASFPPDKVKTQLKRILAGPEFVTGKKVIQFLSYVVEQSLNGQSDSIKQYAIAVDALGYKDDFEPTTNPTVRLVARRLRRALDQYYDKQGHQTRFESTSPKEATSLFFWITLQRQRCLIHLNALHPFLHKSRLIHPNRPLP